MAHEKGIKKEVSEGVYVFPNGATLIYFKQNVNNTTAAKVGFTVGANQDGDIPGISHFLEHMLFASEDISEDEVNKTIRDTNTIQNASTTERSITLDFNCPNSNLDKVLELNAKMLAAKNFNNETIQREYNVICEEINMYANQPEMTTMDYFVDDIMEDEAYDCNDILGTFETLKDVTPETLKAHSDKYFTSENLVMTVVSNIPFEEIKEKMEKYFVSKFPSNPKTKISPKRIKYNFDQNYFCYTVKPDMSVVDIEIAFENKNIHMENLVHEGLENYILNDFAGMIYNNLRTKNGLVYSASFENLNLTNLRMKNFHILTSPAKINDCLVCIADIVDRLRKDGITQQELDAYKLMIKSREDRVTQFKTVSPETLFNRYLTKETIFYDSKKLQAKLKAMTVKSVNAYLKKSFTNSNMFISMVGSFDPAKVFTSEDLEALFDMKPQNLVEIDTNYELKKQLVLEAVGALVLTEEEKNAFIEVLETKYKIDCAIREEYAKQTNNSEDTADSEGDCSQK